MAISAKVASMYVDLVARTASFDKALAEANMGIRKFNSGVQSQTREAKGSMMLLGEEIGVRLPRHLQTFLAGLPGVAPAMSAAFNAVAVFALIDIVFKAGEKIYEFAQKNEEAARKHAEAWHAIDQSLHMSNDQLQLSIDKTDNAISKLEHKPKNALKEAIDEAIVSADTLGQKLTADVSRITEVLKQGQIGLLSRAAGNSGNSDVTDHSRALQTQLEVIQTDFAGVEKSAMSKDEVDAERKRLSVEYRDAIAADARWASGELAKLTYLPNYSDNPHKVAVTGQRERQNSLTDYQAGVSQLGIFNDLSEVQSEQAGKLSVLQGAKDAADEAKRVAAARAKADVDRMRAFETTLASEKEIGTVSAAQEMAFWQAKIAKFTAGSQEYLAVIGKYNTAHKAEDSILDKARKTTIGVDPGFGKPGQDDKGTDGLAAVIARNEEAHAKLSAQWAEAANRIGLMTGALTPHEAALASAAIHTDEYRLQLVALQDELAKLHQFDGLQDILGPNKEHQAKEQITQTQIDQITGAAHIQQMQDAVASFGTTWHGMVDGIFDEIIVKSQHTEAELAQIATRTIDSINGALAQGMTGNKMDFSKIFESAAQSLAKTGLEKVEGSVLKAFGLGGHKNADGYHMWVDNLPGGSSSSAVGGAAGKSLMGMLNDSNFFSSIFGGRIFGAGGIFGGGHALGGSVAAGVPIDVGELGRERFIPDTPGRIVPHNQLGGGPLVGYIDARGTDPALTQANVYRAMQQTHAQAVSDAGRAMVERQRRMPA